MFQRSECTITYHTHEVLKSRETVRSVGEDQYSSSSSIKERNREDPPIYILVSLTSFVCELLVKLMKITWMAHLEKNLPTGDHFGFRAGNAAPQAYSVSTSLRYSAGKG